MIVHHEQAVEMSDILLAKDDVDSDVVSLAEDIRDAQQPEIDQMVTWLQAWGHEPDDNHSGHGDHGAAHEGMMGEEDIAELETTEGKRGFAPVLRTNDRPSRRCRFDGEGPPGQRGEPPGPGTVRRDHQRPAG